MGINLLNIETDIPFRQNLSRHLRLKQWNVYETDQRIEIKKILKRKNIDVVLLGLIGLNQEGLSILRMIKKVRPFIEVIIINRSEQIALSIEGMKLGAFDDFIVPLDLESLARRIREAHQKKKENEKTKKSPLQRFQDIMVAASFAEAGEADMAREFLGKEKKSLVKDKKEG